MGKANPPYPVYGVAMTATLTITAKGQVTLKKQVLEHLGVRPGDQVEVDLLPGGAIGLRQRPTGLAWSQIRGVGGNPHGVTATIAELNLAIERAWTGADRGDPE